MQKEIFFQNVNVTNPFWLVLLFKLCETEAETRLHFQVLSFINSLSIFFLYTHTAIIEHVRDGCMVRAQLLPDYYLVTVMLSGIKVSFNPSLCNAMNKRNPISFSRNLETNISQNSSVSY